MKTMKRLLTITLALATVLSFSVFASASDLSTRTIINKEVAPGVVLLDEGYDTDFGVYAFTKTYRVNLQSTIPVCFLPDELNLSHHDGVWIKLVDDASSQDAPVEFTIHENDRSSWGWTHYSQSGILHEGNEKIFRLTDPVGCKFSVYAKFVSSEDNGTITVKVSCDDYETMD